MNWKDILDQILKLIIGQVSKSVQEPVKPVESEIEPESAPVQHIVLSELNPKNFPTTPEIDANLKILLERVNKIRNEWGKPMQATSGLRSMEDHLRIYAAKGITDKSKIPMSSKHLFGQAVDIFDPELKLTAWLKENDSQRLMDAQLWCESGNSNWVHFQISPPSSGSRWFNP